MDDDEGVLLAKAGPLSWRSDEDGEEVIFTAERITESGGNRLVEQERAYRAGAKLDSTDWKALRWRIESAFNNTHTEPGIGESPVMYPDRLNRLIRSFARKETGNLYLPTRGFRRVKASSYERDETIDNVDAASVVFLFVEDSEDVINLDALSDPLVSASLNRLAEQTKFSAERIGSFSDDLVDLATFASQVETVLLGPSRALQDLRAQNKRNRLAHRRIRRAERDGRLHGRGQASPFARADGASVERLLLVQSDMEAGAADEKNADRGAQRPYRVQGQSNIFDIATALGQSPDALMEINQGLVDDLTNLVAGTVIRVFR
jgi:hypothetical protein